MGAKHSSPKTTKNSVPTPPLLPNRRKDIASDVSNPQKKEEHSSSAQEAADLTSFDAAALPPELRELILSFCTIEMVANRLPLVCREFRNICANSFMVWANIWYREVPNVHLPGETAAAIREELLASRFFKFGTWEIHIHRGQICVLNVYNREGAVFMFRPRDSAPPCINVQCMASTTRYFENGYFPEQPKLVDIPKQDSTKTSSQEWHGERRFGAYLLTECPFGERHLRISCDQIPVYFFCNERANGWALLRWKDSAVPEMPTSPHSAEESKGKVTVWSSSVVIPAAEFGHPYPRLNPKENLAIDLTAIRRSNGKEIASDVSNPQKKEEHSSSAQEAADLTSFDATSLPPELRELILSFCTIEMVANRLPLVCREFRDICANSFVVWANIWYREVPNAPLPGETAAVIREELLASRFFKFGTWEIYIHRGQIFVLNVHNREGAVFMFRPRDSAPPCINVQCMASTIRHFENGYLPEQPKLVEIPNEKSVRTPPQEWHGERRFGAYLFTECPFGERHLRISCDQIPVYFFCNEHANGWALLRWKDSAVPEMPTSPHCRGEQGQGDCVELLHGHSGGGVWASIPPVEPQGDPHQRLMASPVIWPSWRLH
ncbi:hypothetical protein PAPYR_5956 [Paratrimastix pyriformis]|uniref:F-box domain-containing protein n=1 Tax=Paratrimastix pyriformis TaxID=342808 RepID=A0ABQ8UK07_9EUKA|nr:hypothetical protein PAPYR_5956 [Paratrimastix pyriformis]